MHKCNKKYAIETVCMQLKNMREFNLNKEAKKIYTPHIINMLNIIHEYKGKQTLYIEAKKVLNIQIK